MRVKPHETEYPIEAGPTQWIEAAWGPRPLLKHGADES
jgi:hypothetical protein